ncbi:hypothetical protein BVG79_01952 [Ketogulonicigenium robustum]|uniref:Carboxyvinyl-carboxyphosphonate phosphorylmutase n=1 Tax=Ketogulonicigenium robustum TaxID=92947 RepID=A0A1W6P1H6_9RHOB|nr:isocitrate lyase/phosphoenolpyruvate mutase family protein [Ketogulonicigenium robustum]ARO15294.1 hypothetical protein BVG79_01952 [Ketogulonicigenium robustum]
MTTQTDKALHLRSLHVPYEPLVLVNIWDAGSAAAVAAAGAKALATGSWSVAAAQGYPDGEALPLDAALASAGRIAASVDLPVTVDFEGGYAPDPQGVGENVRRLLDCGVVGLNFEDQVVHGGGIYPVGVQADRVQAVRRAADACGVPAVINARTDLFLHATSPTDHAGLVDEALARCAAYAAAGADCFFVPGLTDLTLIGQICAASSLPVNVMMRQDLTTPSALAALGVARISMGPAPYRDAMARLQAAASAYY